MGLLSFFKLKKIIQATQNQLASIVISTQSTTNKMSPITTSLLLSAAMVCLLSTSMASQDSQSTCPCPELHGAIRCPSGMLRSKNNYRLHDSEERGLVGSCLPDTKEK